MIFNWIKGNITKPAPSDTKSTGEGTSPAGLTNQPEGLVENAVALATGLEMVDAFYPGHDPIDYYGDGGFRFGPMSHQGAVMFLPSGIRRWDVTGLNDIALNSFDKIVAEKEDIEILLIGTGQQMSFLNRSVTDALRKQGIKIEVMDTSAAVGTLNILLSEGRAVAAALLPVD
ncbi:Mth938-like domain-containing protein [Cohaesibacter celericrescens]|uniref:Mth938-like domain-containing protein n=1 Tax=Cohaesibacter celericrescens TaxID=2067669 RepID=UPI003563A912